MDEPDDAFCPLLWQANGGHLDQKGQPIFSNDLVRGRCHEPGDCTRCELMYKMLVNLASQGVTSIWICSSCAGVVYDEAEELGIDVRLPGFYSEGACQRPKCHRGEQWGDQGRYSSLLQLLTVLGTTIP